MRTISTTKSVFLNPRVFFTSVPFLNVLSLAVIAGSCVSGLVLAQNNQIPPSRVQRAAGSNKSAASSPSLPATDPWRAAAPYPIDIARYAFAQNGEDLYVISGITNGEISGTPVKGVRRYNATTDVWISLANIPVASEAPAGVYVDEKLYVVDGRSGANLIRIYDIATNTWSAGPARPGVADSYGAAAGAFNGNVYVVGGGSSASATLSIYNIAGNSWSAGPAAPSPFQLGGYAQIAQFLYLIGSFTSDVDFNTTVSMRFDMATDTWSTGPVWAPARADFALAAAGTKLIAIGGDLNGGFSHFNPSAQVDELETSSWPGGAWVPSPDNLPSNRQGNRAGFVSTGRVGGEIWSTGGISGSAPINCLAKHLFRGPAAPAATLTVTNASDGVAPGPAGSLRRAISDAALGDTIKFSLPANTVIDLTSGQLLIDKNLTITGPGANLLTVRRSPAAGTPQSRIFYVDSLDDSVSFTLEGLTVANGNVANESISPYGGGIYNFLGSVTLRNSAVSGNSAVDGGGIINNGGIFTITNSTISGNSATNVGGGISNSSAMTITNTTVSGNSASGAGGGIFYNGFTLAITNSTIAGNTANDGGGIYHIGFGTGPASIRNTIIASNTAVTGPDYSGALTSLGFNLIRNTSGTTITGDPTGNQLNIDPLIGPLSPNDGSTRTHALLAGSPAIDKGHSSGISTDQRGFTRPIDTPAIPNVGDGSDIGAYEVQPDQLPGCGNTLVSNNNDSGTGSLRNAIANACPGSTITFAPSVIGAINLTSGELVVNKFLIISGPGADLLTVQRDASAGNFRVFNIVPNTANVFIAGLTIANGNAPANGGAISNTGKLTLTNVIISNNSANDGGGVVSSGTLTINSSTICANSATSGLGGGVYNTGALTIKNSTISGNSATEFFSLGIAAGGGILNTGTATITNSTITGNTSEVRGGGIRNTSGGTVTSRNTIIALNTSPSGPDFDGLLTSDGFNLIGDFSGGTLPPGPVLESDQIGTAASPIDPLLDQPLQNNGGPTLTHALIAGSPAIDTGHSSGSSTDQRGLTRPTDNPDIENANGSDGSDIGAFEVQLICSYDISPIGDAFPASGGTGSIGLITAANCEWAAESNDEWITITSNAEGVGSSTVNYTVASSSAERTGTITVAGMIYTVDQSGPTAITLISFTASGYDSGVMLEWETGLEVNNLGFRVYRYTSGPRILLNSEPVGGSALIAGPVALTAGRSYAWWDHEIETCEALTTECQNAQYWLEDLDLSGRSTWHGPFYVKQLGGKPPALSQAALLSSIGRQHVDSTREVEPVAELSRVTQSVSTSVSVQVESLASSRAAQIGVKRAGWYRIFQTDLDAAGFNVNVDPRMLRLVVDGEELPVLVTGEDDGRFDATDAVEFYGIGLNTLSTETRVYWLVAGSQRGLRIANAPAAKGYPSRGSFSYTAERRDRTVYFSALRNGDDENFFGAVLAGDPVDQKLTINSISQSQQSAVINVSLQGVTGVPHQVTVSLNGSSIGRVFFNGQASGRQAFEVSHSMLRAGENVITLQSVNGPSDISLIDAVSVTYQHSYRAENDSLRFTANSGETVTVGGFTTKDIQVFDVSDARDVQRLAVSIDEMKDGYAATVTASAPRGNGGGIGERKLLASTAAKANRSARIRLNEPSNWRSANNSADLVIITARELFAAIEPLKKARMAEGYKVAVIDVQDLYDEFTYGNKSPNSVRDFLREARSSWKLAPRFVLFAGDASYDPKNYLGLGENELVPTKMIDTAYLETASDDWFSDLDDDGIADLATGRLPVRSLEEAARAVAKLVEYRQSKQSSSVLLVSDQSDGFDFERASSQLRSLIPPGVRVEELRRGRLEPATAKAQLLEAIERGTKLINYAGHGSATQWRGSLLSSEDAQGLTNIDRLPVFVMMSCLNGYFQDAVGESLAESLMNAEGGAIAVWASTGLTSPEEQSLMNQALYRLLFDQKGKGLSLGEATAKAKMSIRDVDVRRSWVLLGDPTMRLKYD